MMPWELMSINFADIYYTYLMGILNNIKPPDFAVGNANITENSWWVTEPMVFFDITTDDNDFDDQLCFSAQT